MAEVNLNEDRAYVNPIIGRVSRVNHSRNGGVATLEVKMSERDKYPTYVTVWNAVELGLVEGARVALRGFLSVRPDSYEKNGETKHIVAVHLNGAKIISQERPQYGAQPPADTQQGGYTQPGGYAPQNGGYSSAPADDDEMPF